MPRGASVLLRRDFLLRKEIGPFWFDSKTKPRLRGKISGSLLGWFTPDSGEQTTRNELAERESRGTAEGANPHTMRQLRSGGR